MTGWAGFWIGLGMVLAAVVVVISPMFILPAVFL